jgi:uncharacterized protein YaaW (UPF0174 family)
METPNRVGRINDFELRKGIQYTQFLRNIYESSFHRGSQFK